MEERHGTKFTNLNDVGFPINQELVGYDEKLGINFIYDVTTTNISFIKTAKDLS